jgi:hypothetical protein
MPNLKLEFTIDTGDIDVDTARAVSQREDVQAMLLNLIEGTLITVAQNDLAKMQAPGEQSFASEATRRINLLPLDLPKATARTNDYGRLPLSPLVDAIIEDILAMFQQGQDAIDAGDFAYALALGQLGEEKIGRIPELI